MKKSITFSQDATTVNQNTCSEKKCITCFENRGCMYEQYLISAMLNMEESYPVQQQKENGSAAIWKQSDINIINYTSQKDARA